MTLKRSFLYIVVIFLVTNQASTLAQSSQEDTSCRNCGCIEELGAVIFSGETDVNAVEDWAAVAPSCLSPGLPSPKRKFLWNNIKRYNGQAGEAGPLANCGATWAFYLQALREQDRSAGECSRRNAAARSAIGEEIVARCDEDQFLAGRFVTAMDAEPQYSDMVELCGTNDRVLSALNIVVRFENAAYLTQLPLIDHLDPLLAGNDEAINAAIYFTVQHSEMYPDLQKEILEQLITIHKRTGNYNGQRIAGLADRISQREGGKQIYGTHIVCGEAGAALANPTRLHGPELDAKRAELGLPPLDEYLAGQCQPDG